MNDLPPGWAIASIEELSGVNGMVTDGDWIESKDQDPNGNIRLIQLMDIGDGHFQDRSRRFVNEETAARLRCTFINVGDVLVARMPDPLGRACVFPGVGNAAITAVDVFIWRPGDMGADPNWLKYAINAPAVREAIERQAGGTTRQRVAGGRLKALQIPVPPLAEQRRIVAKLDALTARTARARADLDRVPALAARYKQAVLKEAFVGRLTADWRRMNGLSGMERWEISTLGQIADIQSGLALGKQRRPGTVLVSAPYLRVANVQRGWLDLRTVKNLELTPSEKERLALKPGDILLNEGGDLDKLGRGWVWRGEVEGCVHQNHVFRMRLHDPVYPPEYISHYTNEQGATFFIDEGNQTTGLASISKSRVVGMPIRLPPVNEAREIVRRINHAFAEIDRLTVEAAAARRLLDRLDQAILSKAFRGELVPQDPADEPASVLLERIRAERAGAPAGARRGRRAKVA